ncbi:MAG TPA: hypothetical protein VKY73_13030 [Polyangiaceae bacterium]|nr:hypothetical protein [Polyangiaceae bacterium]
MAKGGTSTLRNSSGDEEPGRADREPEESAEGAERRRTRARLPSVFLAFVIASLVSVSCVLDGALQGQQLGVEGGCAIAYLPDVSTAVGAWVVTFPVTWILTAFIRG